MRLQQLVLSLLTIVMSWMCIFSTHAQEWPNNSIRLLIPFAPGGRVDGAGRILARALEEDLKVSVIVENRAGANGTIAMNVLRQSKPDGYTLSMVSTGALDVDVWLMNLPYDPAKDFTYLAPMVKFPFYLSVIPSSGIKTVGDLIARAKANPGTVSYSTPGVGNGIHLASALLSQMTGTTMTHVPYKGAGPAAVALLGGEVTFTFGSGPSILGQVDAGKVIVLGVSSIDRVPNRQNFPTLNELGFKGYESNSLGGVVGPAGLPPAVSAKISQTIQRIVNSKDMQDKILAAGMVPLPGTGKDFEVMITKDRIRYGALIKEMDIK